MQNAMLQPVIGLVLWSFVMWFWMYGTRLPAMAKLKIMADTQKPNADFIAQLPAGVRWKSDNLNNLMEQPTLFYAVALTLVLLDAADGVNVLLAWTYVGLRVVHSLVQASVNVVPARFLVFAIGSMVLLALTVRAALLVF